MTPQQLELIETAAQAASNAYAPYSKFRVGAAVLTEKGVYTGANIENACTNLGICAERLAIAHARMHGATAVVGIALNCLDAPRGGKASDRIHMTIPCGGCRQWMAELAPDAWLITNGSDRIYTLKDLLPVPFRLSV